jgi:large subunit ribosomal protein L10
LAISRERKEDLVAQYTGLLEQTNGFVVIQYRGMTVKQTQDLRAKIREAEGQYMVTKNTLFTKALQSQGWPVPDNLLQGPTAVAFGLENLPGVAKAVLDFVKELDNPEKATVTGGVMTGDILDPSRVETVSKLPTLDELRSQIAGLIVSPATGLVTVLSAATGQVVNVIQAYLDDNNSDDDGEAA